MGFFTDLAQKYVDFSDDMSYPSPIQQLLMRLDDLSDRREELTAEDAPIRGWSRLTDDDIRYAIPEFFDSLADVERAFELAVEELKNDYDIDVLAETENAAEKSAAIPLEQLSLFEIIPMQPPAEPLKAA